MNQQLAKLGKLPILRRQSSAVGEVIGAFESDTVAVFVRTAPKHEHVILYVLAAMFVITLVLMSTVKIERAVTSVSGRIVTVAGPLYVSPFDTGIVRKINVHVG